MIYMELILFSLIILIYWVITELFTMLFRFTGLPDERARFQVISLLTGTGFTTRESEMFISNRRRRALARATMLFGYVFNITIVSAFINVFLTLKLTEAEHTFLGILIPLTAIALVFIFMRVPSVRSVSDHFIEKLADRLVGRTHGYNSLLLVDYIGSENIARVKLNSVPKNLVDVPLSESGVREAGILVLMVEHVGEKPVPAGADTVLASGDRLTVFGSYKSICKTFHARESFGDD